MVTVSFHTTLQAKAGVGQVRWSIILPISRGVRETLNLILQLAMKQIRGNYPPHSRITGTSWRLRGEKNASVGRKIKQGLPPL